MRRILIAAALVLTIAPAWAGSPPPQPAEPEPPALLTPQLRGALQDLGRSLLGVLRALPRYEAPRLDGDGNIVIPRAPDSGRGFFAPSPGPARPTPPGLIAV